MVLRYIRNYNCNETGHNRTVIFLSWYSWYWSWDQPSATFLIWFSFAVSGCWLSPHTIWFIVLLRSLPMGITLWSCDLMIIHTNWFNISVKTSDQQRNCTWKTSIGIQNFIIEDGLMSLTSSQKVSNEKQIICFEFFSTFERLFSMM